MLERYGRGRAIDAAAVVGDYRYVTAKHLFRNDWNPNVMTDAEEAQLAFEIQRFGFVQPVIVRPHPSIKDGFEIIDGEHRVTVGSALGLTGFPCWVIDVDRDTAMQLTPILNELHGTPDEAKLGDLLKDLLERQPESDIREAMPFSRQKFDELIGEITVDWGALEAGHPTTPTGPSEDRWVERVYRMPAAAAEVVDQAVAKAREEADAGNDWQGLEFIAAEYMAR